MQKAIYFDMDGTIANLYAVENWLPKLRAYDPTPYAEAAPMVHLSTLARVLHRLQANGYHIGIVSWLSKDPDPTYGEAVTEAKVAWLAKHLPSVIWDEVKIIPYGIPKSSAVQFPMGVLFDDEAPNRHEWQGEAFDVDEIIKTLCSF